MGLLHTLGVVLHPQRDCSAALTTILAWAAEREVTVLGLATEMARLACDAEVQVPSKGGCAVKTSRARIAKNAVSPTGTQ